GTYTAALTITDSSGNAANASTVVTVYDPLRLTGAVSPSGGQAPLMASLTGSATGGLPPYQFTWQLGDGASATGAAATHSYSAGTFSVTLTVRDSAGGVVTGAGGTVTATAPDAPPSSGTGGPSSTPTPAPPPPAPA